MKSIMPRVVLRLLLLSAPIAQATDVKDSKTWDTWNRSRFPDGVVERRNAL
jgi:hypothetical protein